MKSPENIQSLINLLSKSSLKDYNSILKNFDFESIDFSTFQSWSKDRYTRNCLFRDVNFELILICWNQDQETSIHGHNGEDCWVYLIDGEMEEVFFEQDQQHKLLQSGSQKVKPKQLTFMNDKIGFHKLKNSNDGKSMSLHVYAKPIENCVSFDETSNEFIERTLSYDTFKELTIRD
ncbi:cysteine dioxygenase [Psychroserpens sp. Hel_I_66]|uniref:cysteine dioxygenase n=1 Tax=Psychroserpens sp. Hel_I_66 TaxID=1250004 RepID=UPI000AD78D03|nr:cysteine dioxygenase family protein [Psychroserpens sp. Hel_I_66]